LIKLKNIAYLLVSASVLVFILITGRGLIIPFVFAILVWFIVREIRTVMNKVGFVNRWFPLWFKNILAFSVIIITGNFIISLVISNINELSQSYLLYETNLKQMIEWIDRYFKIDLIVIIKEQAKSLDFGTIAVAAIRQSTDLASNLFMILIYTLFIFLEETSFGEKIKLLNQSNINESGKALEILNNIDKSVSKYLGVKLLTSAITGIASYITLWLIGVDYPFFWSFIIFILNFIPTVGSIVATLFPALFSALQYGEWIPFAMVLIFVGSIQMIVGNILEPAIMGRSMNISPIVTILALSFWGAIWGITGMILSVPMMVIIIIILAQFEHTKPYAILLSSKGEI
jgi:predicted PurR-regulated permease PerM